MDLNPGQLEALVAIAEHGSFDAAARRLHVTPSAISQRIRALEATTGQVLISRATPCRPTPHGEWLVRLGRQTRLLFDEASQALTEAGPVELPVAVNADSLTVWFGDVLAVVAHWDGVAIRLHVEDEAHSAQLLRSGDVLAAVTGDPAPVQGCSAERLGALRYLPAAAPWFAQRWRRGDSPDWAAMPVVNFGDKDDLQFTMLRRLGVAEPPPVVHQVPSSSDFCQAVRIGLGWGMLPELQASADLAAGELVLLSADAIDVPLYWQRWRLDSPRLAALTNAVRTAADRHLALALTDWRVSVTSCAEGKANPHLSVAQWRFARFGWLRVSLLSCCIGGAAMAVTSCATAVTAQPVAGLPRPASSAPASSAPASSRPTGLADQPIHPGQAGDRVRVRRVRTLAVRDQFAGCEQRIKIAPQPRPTVAIVGASYTAGVGPDNPMLSWAVDLVRKLRWDSVIYGVPGAGYVRTGNNDLGPMARMLTDERLTGLSPTLVLIQAGYDDGRVPVGIEGQQVRRTVELIKAEAPQATIGLITVFTSPARPIPARFYRIDSAIVAAAKAVDPQAIIMDPLTGDWKYQHADDGLHPTAAGDAWIARKVEAILHAHGVDSHPAITAAAAPIICDEGIRTTATGSEAGI